MSISPRNKRRITVSNRLYFWWVFNEVDQTAFDGNQIKLVAEDQSHYIKYGLEQSNSDRNAVISLRNEVALIAIACPKFEDDNGIITPGGIRKLIEWCTTRQDEQNLRVITHAYASGYTYPLTEEQRLEVYNRVMGLFE